MIVADSLFTIGDAHIVCEDYAAVVESPDEIKEDFEFPSETFSLPLAVLSDGCSSSQETDIGARLIVSLARRLASFRKPNWTDSEMGEAVITRAWGIAHKMFRKPECLDATLLYVQKLNNEFRAVMYGDGAVVAERKDGELSIFSVEFTQGAPAYLNYLNDENRMKRYLELSNNAERIVSCFYMKGAKPHGVEVGLPEKRYVFEPDIFRFPLSDYDLVAVLSDGVSSFERSNDSIVESLGDGRKPGKSIPITDVIEQLMDYKTMRGAFVNRRARRFLTKFCKENNWRHYDDLSMAAIYCGDEE